jgi:hypothetical protein
VNETTLVARRRQPGISTRRIEGFEASFGMFVDLGVKRRKIVTRIAAMPSKGAWVRNTLSEGC